MNPRIGFNAIDSARQATAGTMDEKLIGKVGRCGADAARKKFPPEFINRLDKIVTFRPLGSEELRQILDMELGMVQQRIFSYAADKACVFKPTASAKGFLLQEGTDMKYGARHLKRAIERLLVQPMSNLLAPDQLPACDGSRVTLDANCPEMRFVK